jgi:hypothetical protein
MPSLSIQCVHKVHSGFWKIVAGKEIELAICGLRQITAKLWKFFFEPIQIPLSPDKHTGCPQSPLGVLKNCGAPTNSASHMRFATDYSETLEVFFIPFKFHYHQTNIQCVHKVHSGFWKIVVRKLIELATCGLRQITAKLWKFFSPFKFHYHQTNIQCVHKVHSGCWKIVGRKLIELATCGLRQITAKLWKFFLSHSNSIITRQAYSVSTKSTRGFEKLWRAN